MLNFSRVVAVLRREAQEILKSRGLLLAIFLPPLLITILPLIGVAFLGNALNADPDASRGARDLGPFLQTMPELQTWTAGEVTVFIILQQFLTFFLLMPLIIPMSIAAQSIVGEKQAKSLEPLLATPIKTSELLFAKAVAAMLPAVLATWAAFVIFISVGRILISSDRVYAALLNPKWLVAMLILAPLLSLLSVSIAVIISSRVNDTRAVQQIGGFIVMPIVILGIAQTTGLILLNAFTFIIGALVVAGFDALILRIGVRLFQREKILTQWK
jgi:ABC-2 type transport system permease protein